MKIKILIEDQYTISAVMNNDTCPVQDSLVNGIKNHESHSDGFIDMITRIAEDGFGQFSSKQCHYIDSDHKIFELVRGRLRLVFFRGKGETIVVCTEVIVKDSQKANKKVVNRASKLRKDYYNSIEKGTLIEIRDREDENE